MLLCYLPFTAQKCDKLLTCMMKTFAITQLKYAASPYWNYLAVKDQFKSSVIYATFCRIYGMLDIVDW